MSTGLSGTAAVFLVNVNRAEQRIAEANSQVTSGKKINVPSDAPDQIDSLLQLRANLQRNTQIQSNLVQANTDATSADNALSSASALMDRAVTLATQGANSTATSDTRSSLAQEVASIQAQMVSYSQTQVGGRYIFSGDQDDSPTYRLNLLPPPDPSVPVDPGAPVDPATVTGVTQISDASATREVEDPAGGSFGIAQTAQQIFNATNSDGSPATGNVFAALNSLRVALLTNDQTGIANSIDSLKAASSHINDAQAFYGTVENRIQDATTFANQYNTQLQTQIGNTEDADAVSAALTLTQANTQLQAAFQMEGKMPTHSLFDFLA